jgi:hypothetical protein
MAHIAKLFVARKPAQDSQTYEMDLDRLSTEVRHYLMEYALDVIRQRTYAKEDATSEDVRRRFDALVDGQVPSAGGPRLDPVEKEFRDLLVKAAIKHKVVQKAPKVADIDEAAIVAKLAKKTGRQDVAESLRANAEHIVRMRNSAL